MRPNVSKTWPFPEMSKTFAVLSAVGIALFLTSLTTFAQPLETYCYRETRGSDIRYFFWTLVGGDPLVLGSGDGVEWHLNVLGPQGASLGWLLADVGMKTDLRILRNGPSLQLAGLFSGQSLERVVAIDDAPWYQALSIGLRNLLHSRTTTLEFWMVRPDTLDVRRMRAERGTLEVVDVEGVKRQARRVRTTAVGIPAWIWHGDYWFDDDSGVFLRYQGRSGPPGAPMNLIELSSKPLSECAVDFGESLLGAVRELEPSGE